MTMARGLKNRTLGLVGGRITPSTRGHMKKLLQEQLLCDRLGIHPDQVHYVQGDTDKVAIGEGTGGSRSAALGGSAVHLATEKIIVKAKVDRRVHARRDTVEID